MRVFLWVFTIVSIGGSITLSALVSDAWGNYNTAKRSGDRRLVLNARVIWRVLVSWMVGLILFAVAGFVEIIGSGDWVRWTARGLLVVAATQIVVAGFASMRDNDRLKEIIEEDIRRRRRQGA